MARTTSLPTGEGQDPQVTRRRVMESSIIHFQYIGKTGLTVIGPITGRRYRFDHPGAFVGVDGRDAGSMAAVPNLRRAKAPG
jgi:hypothetical protein